MISKKLLAVAIILSLLTAVSVYFYLKSLEESYDTNQYVKVYEAVKDIAANSKITRELFKEKEIPVQYVHSKAVRDIEKAIGRITKVPLAAGEILLESHLAQKDGIDDGLAYIVPEGKRAVAVSVDEVSAVSYLVLPGDRVDIIATLDLEEEKADGNKKEVTQTSFLLQNLEVLAVGSNIRRNPLAKEKKITTVTLAVSPEDAPRLVLASERGTIRLLLRSPVDKKIVNLPSVRLEDMLERR